MLKCKYCGSRVTRMDRNCPNCGADITDVLEEDNKKRKEEIDKKREQIAEEYNKVSKKMSIAFIGVGVIILLIFGLIIYSVGKVASSTKKDNEKIIESFINEQAKGKEFIVSCEEIEEYNMVADFNGYTDSVMKEGYQQLAFHIKLTNITDKKLDFFLDDIDFVLLADGTQMNESSVLENTHFRHEENGKKFETLSRSVAANASIDGWIGYYVKKDAKELELRVKNIVIKMDNPAYKGE